MATSFERQLGIINFYDDTGSMRRTLAKFFPELKKGRFYISHDIGGEVCDIQYDIRRQVTCTGHGLTLGNDSYKTIVTRINLLRKDGVAVSSTIANLMKLPEGSFAASPSWQKGFLRRNRLAMRTRTRQGQTTPAEADETVRAFATKVSELMVTHGIEKIYNADQTGVFFDKDKERLTATLLGDNEGNKYPPFIVVQTTKSKRIEQAVEKDSQRHGLGKAMWKNVKPAQDATGLQVYGNRTAWWNSRLSLAFLNYHFGSRDENDTPVLLLWDDFSERVPPKFTYVCQPADISWNQPVKSRLRRAWVDHITDSVESDSIPYVYKPPSRERFIEWVAEAWSELSKDTIQSGFVHAKFPAEGRRVVAEELDSDNVAEILESLCLIDTNVSDLEPDDDLSCVEASEEDGKGTKDSGGEDLDVEMSECYM
uniref:Uncharacterized protein AlNc14C569G12174 n=1 Tax=Albugo laibachii Nc14 TaxID=890382 RepID=F0X180_9STRA|nr:conserved hypothetical protein [Albugo laibachii Nc14]|eukprot:CCA27538.1 conserved hypothetical protein [Albugo laibachii Nc14]